MENKKLVQITRREKIAEEDFPPFIDDMFEQVWGNLLPPQILTGSLSNTISENVITPKDAPIPDCITCGACCASLLCVNLNPGNRVSSKDYWDITKQGENGEFTVDRFLKRKEEDFSCTALEGKVGEKVGCRIYEDRPRMCRMFEAGSDRCHAVRRAYNIEPFLSLMEMYEAVQIINAQEDDIGDDERIETVSIFEKTGTQNLQIRVKLKNGFEKIIHTFDRKSETWFQAEFEGLTLVKADELINKRTRVGTSKK